VSEAVWSNANTDEFEYVQMLVGKSESGGEATWNGSTHFCLNTTVKGDTSATH
jgi:hypothetical protein